ncbi:MAG TPA: hypothetical protein V6D43_24340 [Candidatus Sericytochromatia bacterium]
MRVTSAEYKSSCVPVQERKGTVLTYVTTAIKSRDEPLVRMLLPLPLQAMQIDYTVSLELDN